MAGKIGLDGAAYFKEIHFSFEAISHPPSLHLTFFLPHPPSDHPPINQDIGPRNITRILPTQERDHARNITRRPHPLARTQPHHAHHHPPPLVLQLQLPHRRPDDPWTDAINPCPPLAIPLRTRPNAKDVAPLRQTVRQPGVRREAVQDQLRRRRAGQMPLQLRSEVREMPRHAANADQTAAVRDKRIERLDHVRRALQIDLVDLRCRRRCGWRDARGVDDGREGPERRHCLHGRERGDVDADGRDGVAFGEERRGCRVRVDVS